MSYFVPPHKQAPLKMPVWEANTKYKSNISRWKNIKIIPYK